MGGETRGQDSMASSLSPRPLPPLDPLQLSLARTSAHTYVLSSTSTGQVVRAQSEVTRHASTPRQSTAPFSQDEMPRVLRATVYVYGTRCGRGRR